MKVQINYHSSFPMNILFLLYLKLHMQMCFVNCFIFSSLIFCLSLSIIRERRPVGGGGGAKKDKKMFWKYLNVSKKSGKEKHII